MSSEALVADPGRPDVRSAPEPGFSDHLRERTKLVHREAERTGFVADLIRGRASRHGYALYLRNLVPVYAALEAALALAPPGGLLGPFADPALRRGDRLAADLAALSGAAWPSLPLTTDACAYAGSVQAAAASSHRLAAHAYARYLGDLSGGQILRPLLARTLGLGPAMLSFYDFPAFPDPEVPKTRMRRALDGIDPQSPDAESIASEAISAFRHTIAMSTAVAAALA